MTKRLETFRNGIGVYDTAIKDETDVVRFGDLIKLIEAMRGVKIVGKSKPGAVTNLLKAAGDAAALLADKLQDEAERGCEISEQLKTLLALTKALKAFKADLPQEATQ